MNELQALIDKYKISDENARKIFEVFMLPGLKMYTPVSEPVAVIVGGQPGAGKSQVLDLAKVEFENNIVICNPDEYRSFHPNTREILNLHEVYYPDITTKLAQNLGLMLRNECKRQGINFALEITMRDGAGANTTIQGIKNNGFKCNIDLLAVNENWSRLGTIERLEAQRVTEKFGRIVSTEVHDDRYQAMPQAVKEVVDKKLYDNIRIFGRRLVPVKDRIEQQVVLISNNPSDPVSALTTERTRAFTPEERKHFQAGVQRVVQLMKLRKAPANEIIAFKQSFTPVSNTTQKKGGRKL